MVRLTLLATALFAAITMAAPTGQAEEATVEKTQASDDDAPIELMSFLQSCRSCYLTTSNGPALSCECNNGSGGWPRDTLRLNPCLGNGDGWLRWQNNGGFGGSCNRLSLAGDSRLSVYCRTISGNWIPSSVVLNERIHNDRGRMWCGV